MLLWKINNYYTFWVCVCHFNYTTCNAHCGMSGRTLFSPWSHKSLDFVRNLLSIKRVSYFLHNVYLKHFSTQEEFRQLSKVYIRLHVKYSPFCLILMTAIFLDNFRRILKYIKFNENSSSGRRGVILGRTDGQTDRH